MSNSELEAFARFVLEQPDSECGPLIKNKASDILRLPPTGYCPHGYRRAELADGTSSCLSCPPASGETKS